MRMSGVVERTTAATAHDHLAWLGDGAADLADTARRVFAAAAPSELLVLSGDGSAHGLEDEYAEDLASGRLVTMNALDTYAPVLDGGAGACGEQLTRFHAFLTDALDHGYTAMRVVADNTEMLAGTDDQARNWLAWEQLTDRWQARYPVNGNCWFDTSRIDPARLRAAVCRHPVTVGEATPWRLYYDQDDSGALRLELAGEVESFDASELTAALVASIDLGEVGEQPLALSLQHTGYLHHTVPFEIAALAGRGCGLRVTDVSPAVSRLLRWLPPLPGFAG